MFKPDFPEPLPEDKRSQYIGGLIAIIGCIVGVAIALGITLSDRYYFSTDGKVFSGIITNVEVVRGGQNYRIDYIIGNEKHTKTFFSGRYPLDAGDSVKLFSAHNDRRIGLLHDVQNGYSVSTLWILSGIEIVLIIFLIRSLYDHTIITSMKRGL